MAKTELYKRNVWLWGIWSIIHICVHLIPRPIPTVQHTSFSQIPNLHPTITSKCLLSRVCLPPKLNPSIHVNNIPRLCLFHPSWCLRRPYPGLFRGTHINPRDSPRRISRTWLDLARLGPLPSLLPWDVSLQRALRIRLSALQQRYCCRRWEYSLASAFIRTLV